MDRRLLLSTLLIIALLLSLASCAPVEPTEVEYGFLFGIFHGILFPFAVIGKIFNLDVGLYALNNSGTWYWVGYFIGILIICGGGSRAG